VKLNDPWADIDIRLEQGGICGNAPQSWSDPLAGNFYQIKMLKKRCPGLKTFASVGGWTYSKAMHSFIHTAAERTTMIDSLVALYNKYSDVFDGIDSDLEYPCMPDDTACGPDITPSNNDREHFALFMEEMKQKLGPNVPVTIASSADPAKVPALDMDRLNKVLDGFNIMTYDFTAGSWGDDTVGHQTNTYLNPNDPHDFRRTLSVAEAAKNYVDAGCDPLKVNLGVAFYGRGFKINTGATPALFMPAIGGLEFGTWEKNNFDYYDIKNKYMASSTHSVIYDEIAHAPIFFDPALGMAITYDNARSIEEKVKVVRTNGYGGIFAWELSGDTDDYELLKTMSDAARA
jgi:chitinase